MQRMQILNYDLVNQRTSLLLMRIHWKSEDSQCVCEREIFIVGVGLSPNISISTVDELLHLKMCGQKKMDYNFGSW